MKPFSLLVKPASADCNLRCEYCFYLGRSVLYPETKIHRMPDSVLEQMIGSFMATDQPQYAIGWQGGEPTLMGLDFFKRVIDLQKKYGNKSNAIVSNGLQTNTTLITSEWAEHLAKYHFLVGVSIDGPADIHNYYRKYPDGRGSHAAVMQGLKALKQHNVEYNILTLVNHLNVKTPKKIYHYLCNMDVLYHQYIECVEFDKNGELMPFAVTGEEWGNFLCAIYDEWSKADTHRVSIRLFDSILSIILDGVANTCSMGTDCRQYLVVEHNGDIYPCDFFVRPELKLGNIMENTWEELLASPIYEAFGKRKSILNGECLNCPYLKFCAGDCPKNRPTKGKDPTRLSVLCNGWKQFYEHALPGLTMLADEIKRKRQLIEKQNYFRAHPLLLKNVGRNAPCPCGSGKKFKNCCGKINSNSIRKTN